MKIKIVGSTQIHRGDPDKPNEDAWAHDPEGTLVVLADGVTRSRDESGRYPKEVAVVAPYSFVSSMLADIHVPFSGATIRSAIEQANALIAEKNRRVGLTNATVDYKSVDYLGTTGCAFVVNPKTCKAIFAYIGDVIGIHIPYGGEPRLLTRDQLHNCHAFSYAYFSSLVSSEITKEMAKEMRLLYQRRDARNKKSATDPTGNLVGFGVLTGEPEAMDFVEIMEFDVHPGDRFLLATDALRVTASIPEGEEENVFSYGHVLQILHQTSFDELPEVIVDLIRQQEISKKTRSDDATVVVVEIE